MEPIITTNTSPVILPDQNISSSKSYVLLTIVTIMVIIVVLVGAVFFVTSLSGPRKVSLSASPNTALSSSSEFVEYVNSDYGFSVSHPKRFMVDTSTVKKDANYETVAVLKTAKEGERISINIIKNVDIYKTLPVKDVAKREIMDSGYEYSISPTTVNNYDGAITTIDMPEKQIESISISIKHPTRNLFVVFVFPKGMSPMVLEDTMATFKFTN